MNEASERDGGSVGLLFHRGSLIDRPGAPRGLDRVGCGRFA